MTTLGILGGTFDPPHLGHLILAEMAADSLNLDRVLFVPAGDPPHKSDDAVRAPAHHRAAMVECAIAGNPHFALARVDLDRPGPHYSVDMLGILREEHPQAQLYFLIGGDSLHDLPTWSRPQALLQRAMLGVMRRPGASVDLAGLEQILPGIRDRIVWIDAPQIDISASTLADRIAAGQSIRYQTPDAVHEYIVQNGLYRKQTT
jgi:nicotinate-nucleotide adenylyltransferase